MIKARGLTKRFRSHTALRNLDLDLGPGEFAVLHGPNGAGKTTLLKLLCGLLRPTNGTVSIDGESPYVKRGSIGFSGHDSYLYPQLTVEENLRLYARLYGAGWGRAETLLEELGLHRKKKLVAAALSKGEEQKANLVRAMLHEPSLLLLDEPFSGLDDSSVRALSRILAETKTTTLIATHHPEIGSPAGSRALRLDGGSLR